MANNNINELMKLPIWQMTGEEQYRIIQYALGNGASRGEENTTMMPMDMPFAPKRTRIAGVHALAQYMECCDSLVYKLRREGVLDEAIISHFANRQKDRFRRRGRPPLRERIPGAAACPAF